MSFVDMPVSPFKRVDVETLAARAKFRIRITDA
jgi:hypothetical protein